MPTERSRRSARKFNGWLARAITAQEVEAVATVARSGSDVAPDEGVSTEAPKYGGTFAYTSISSEQVLALRARFHVQCTQDGRIGHWTHAEQPRPRHRCHSRTDLRLKRARA